MLGHSIVSQHFMVQYRIHNSSPPVPILSQTNPIHITPFHLQVRGSLEVFVTCFFLRWGVVNHTPNPQTGGPPLVICPRLLIPRTRHAVGTATPPSSRSTVQKFSWFPAFYGIRRESDVLLVTPECRQTLHWFASTKLRGCFFWRYTKWVISYQHNNIVVFILDCKRWSSHTRLPNVTIFQFHASYYEANCTCSLQCWLVMRLS
jgi:hypothetical protein